jgi:hypothetical protein
MSKAEYSALVSLVKDGMNRGTISRTELSKFSEWNNTKKENNDNRLYKISGMQGD